MSLPNAILFPQAVLPLHIFEPRYRAMLNDALESHRMFSIALMRQEAATHSPEPEPHAVGGLGLVRASFRLPDGTSNVLLQGFCRVRFTRFLTGKSYRQAEIEPLGSHHVAGVEAGELAAMVAKLARLRTKVGRPIPKQFLKALRSLTEPETIADIVSAALVTDFRQKQELLEILDLRLRLRKLIRSLELQFEQLKIEERGQGKQTDPPEEQHDQ